MKNSQTSARVRVVRTCSARAGGPTLGVDVPRLVWRAFGVRDREQRLAQHCRRPARRVAQHAAGRLVGAARAIRAAAAAAVGCHKHHQLRLAHKLVRLGGLQ
eukprot:3960300-Prymnesium_polylepis.1